jgi:PAS domain S-box-containing protein
MRSVLFIGDDSTFPHVLQAHFQNFKGITVETVNSTEAGLEKLLNRMYDVVISDHGTPGIDGIEFLKALRASGNETPFILFTASEDKELIIDALNHGANYYLRKGDCFETVLAELDTVIRRFAGKGRTVTANSEFEKRYRTLFGNSDAATVLLNKEGTIAFANKRFEQFSGYAQEQLASMMWMDFIAPGDLERMNELLGKQYAQHEDASRSHQFRVFRRNGDARDILVTNTIIPGTDLQVLSLIDVSEWIRVERALETERERLNVTLHSIGDGVIVTDRDGRVTLLNRAAENLTGWRESEAIGRDLTDVFHIINEKTREPCRNPADMVVRSGSVVGLADHTVLIARDGTERMIADSGAPIRGTGGNIDGVVLVFRMLRERSRQEKQKSCLNPSSKPLTMQSSGLRWMALSAVGTGAPSRYTDTPPTRSLVVIYPHWRLPTGGMRPPELSRRS